ncbi:MAG: ChaN family lipoprotein, partial [Bdellovibrionales bacterium]|nr:ChaN family lipoprotein [Bdellovibrionales bacterium]
MLHDEWLRSRKSLLRHVKSQVHLLAGESSEDVKRYEATYKKEFAGRWQASDELTFLKTLRHKRIVFGGDFHAFSQSQRLHLRVLRKLHQPLILALECFESHHQKWIDKFMASQISEDEFLKKTGWHRKWGFPWNHYRPLVEWAKKAGAQIVGLNLYEKCRSLESLEKRDLHSAKIIAQLYENHPDCLIYVVYGDLHLAQPHLPKMVENEVGEPISQLTLFQNSDELYFRFVRKIADENAVWLKGSCDRYCQMSSPPWVKWQSYLMFLEHSFDHDLSEDGELDFTDHIASLVKFLAKDFELKIPVRDLAVYSVDQGYSEHLIFSELKLNERRIADQFLREGRSFFLPREGLIFLSRLSINHAAALAGKYIHSKLCGADRPFWDQPADFQRAIWVEAVGFFFSKLVNDQRKSETLRTLKARLSSQDGRKLTQGALKLALDQRMLEVIYVHAGRLPELKKKTLRTLFYLEAARHLGEMMGEKLFQGYRKQRFAAENIKSWLKVDPRR